MKRSPLSASLAACILATVTLLLSGCGALSPSFMKPQVSLADIQVHEAKTLETAFLIQLRVSNPNDDPLDIQGISCEVELDGRRFATGLQGEPQTIPAYGSALVPVQVYASVLDMFSSVINMIQHAGEPDAQIRALNYRLVGRIRLNEGGFFRNVPFESEGELKL